MAALRAGLCLAAGLGALAGLWPAGAGAQSLLSEPPETWPLRTGISQPLPDTLPEPRAMSLDQLVEAVDVGEGARVYTELRERLDELMSSTLPDEGDVGDLERWLLLELLRAGEGVAAPEVQLETARRYTETYPEAPGFPLAFFYQTLALFQLGRPLEDSFFFDEAALASLPPWMQTRYLLTRADSARQRGDPVAAAAFRLQERESPYTLRWSTRDDVLELLEQAPHLEALRAFLERHPDAGWLEARRPFLEVKVLINEGRLSEALLSIQRLRHATEAVLSPEDLKLLADAQREVEEIVHTRRRRIGVLLPLGSDSSTLKTLARETLDGLRMALQFQGPPPTPHARLEAALGMELARAEQGARPEASAPPWELVVRDTGNDPEQAAREVETLARRERVMAIIGPLARAESEAAAARAEELRVPLISFSLSLTPPRHSRYVFRHSKSQEEEVHDLVRYAMDYLHARRFTILYPDTGYGRTMMGLFWQGAAARGGRVIGVAPFLPPDREAGSTEGLGLKNIFEAFAGVDRPLSAEEQALIDAAGDSRPDPIVDFDAIYIPLGPDAGRYFRHIAAYPVTVDAEDVQLLGSRFWNDNAVLVSGGGKLSGALFVGTFDRYGERPDMLAFRTRHRRTFGHRPEYHPPTYYTGLAFDTFNLLRHLVEDGGLRSRRELALRLVRMEPYSGITGLTSFLETGEAVKESMFFRVGARDIERVLP